MIKEIGDRRSIRKYKQKEVPAEALHQIIQAGLLAPSGKNNGKTSRKMRKINVFRPFILLREIALRLILKHFPYIP